MVWIIVIIMDTIMKIFQYGGIFIIPVIIIFIFLNKKIKLLKKKENFDKNEINKLEVIKALLILVIFLGSIIIRGYGAYFYKYIIGFSLSTKETKIEKRLEEKYHKNFTFISKGDIEIDKSSYGSIGQNVDNDYFIWYNFKDDDGVVANVYYKKNFAEDYYQNNRKIYDIKQRIYEYAEKNNFDKEFYVFIQPQFSIKSNLYSPQASNGFSPHIDIQFILMDNTKDNEEFIVSALRRIFIR